MEQKIAQFKRDYPDSFFITNDRNNIIQYLSQVDFLKKDEEVLDINKPGEGNMNFVLRVITSKRRFILKQARPWVEKYPDFAAPVERNRIETAFYELISTNPVLQRYSPDILFGDPQSNLSIMTDLGEGSDFLHLYEHGQKLEENVLEGLMEYLAELHQVEASGFPENLAMRQLNHEHIFHFPFIEGNGFDLDQIQSGLAKLSLKYKRNLRLTSTILNLGDLYLKRGDSLIHGDFYPGCWLSTAKGLKVIDPEFCFPGFAEFDLGMMWGHLLLTGQPDHFLDKMINLYGREKNINEHLMLQIGGVAILRRILGVAQLPLVLSLEEKEQIMDRATQWIIS